MVAPSFKLVKIPTTTALYPTYTPLIPNFVPFQVSSYRCVVPALAKKKTEIVGMELPVLGPNLDRRWAGQVDHVSTSRSFLSAMAI
jgi:hypothetical protein